MAFASSSPTIPKLVLAIQRNSFFDLSPQSRRPSDDDVSPPSASNSAQSSFRIINCGATHIEESSTGPLDGGPSSSIPFSTTEPQSKPNSKRHTDTPTLPPLLTDNKLVSSISKPTSSSHSKSHSLLPSILKLKHLNLSLVLQNSGSVARDHLASERTFLAYVHTSLGFAAAGVGVIQLFTITIVSGSSGSSTLEVNGRVQRFAMPLGILMLMSALFVLFLGVYRYFAIQQALPKNIFPATQLPIVFISFVLGVFVAASIGALLTAKMGV